MKLHSIEPEIKMDIPYSMLFWVYPNLPCVANCKYKGKEQIESDSHHQCFEEFYRKANSRYQYFYYCECTVCADYQTRTRGTNLRSLQTLHYISSHFLSEEYSSNEEYMCDFCASEQHPVVGDIYDMEHLSDYLR